MASARRGGGLKADEFEGAENLELLDVFREVAAGESEVDELAFREFGKFFDARFHVVEGDAFAFRDGDEIDGGFDALVVLDGVGGDRHAEIALSLHYGDPEIALEGDAAVLRPDSLHGARGVAFGEDVGDGGGGGGCGFVGSVHGKKV